jgi:hypothetical protein
LEAIPRLQSAALPPPVPELLDAEGVVVDADALADPAPPTPAPVDEEVAPDEAWAPAPAPVDPEAVDEEFAPDIFPPPAPAPVDVECAEPQAMLPATVTNPQTVRSRITLRAMLAHFALDP